MNRLQKKCFIASSALHGLLLLTLLFGAALMPRATPPSNILTIYDARMVTDAATHGGNPAAQAAAPVPPPPQPQPEPPQPAPPVVTKPPVPPKAAQEVKPKDAEPIKAPKLSQEELKLIQPKDAKPPANQTQIQAQAAARDAETQRRAQIASQISSTVRSLKQDMAPSMKVEMPGTGGGPLMANYMDIVRSKYTAAWNPPASLEDEQATVMVNVVIVRDGRVIAHDIIQSSGNASMDKSVKSTLENVTFIEAFPADSKDPQRKFIIKFNLAAKRLTG